MAQPVLESGVEDFHTGWDALKLGFHIDWDDLEEVGYHIDLDGSAELDFRIVLGDPEEGDFHTALGELAAVAVAAADPHSQPHRPDKQLAGHEAANQAVQSESKV